MEDSKQDIKLNLTMANSDISEQNTEKKNYNEADYISINTQDVLVKTEDNSPAELNGLSKKYVEDTQESKGFANSGEVKSEKNENVESIITPQGFWRKRHEANQWTNTAPRHLPSPSRFASLYKTRMPFSPTASRGKEHRGSSDARNTWLMNARKIRMQTSDSGQKSHFRSLSQCNARNRNEETSGVLRRPRRSLDSATATAYQFQENMCLSPQNVSFSFPSPYASCSSLYTTPSQSPYASCSSLYTAPSLDIGDPSAAQFVSYFEVQPKFESYQLVGDSLFVRFAEQILDIPCGTVEGSRGIGLCVSGQKSGDLLRRVSQRMYPVTEKIVLLIGTNDVLQNINKNEMCDTLKQLLMLLKMSVSRIVLLTLPPIPKLQLRPEHWERIHYYNNFIRSLQDGVVIVADIYHLYVTEKQACRMEMFERFYGDGQRTDLIHLNRSGLEEIHKFLLQNNFVN